MRERGGVSWSSKRLKKEQTIGLLTVVLALKTLSTKVKS